ncbi:RAMP superfamily CRISPR-associated protein [Haliscomenobacter sp.]|uniref:RAMP superfamily CRISPR-associated protein n=1 Tax=Haliscomenobacter sp. TaxID=2717303 RepID=UPI00359369C9
MRTVIYQIEFYTYWHTGSGLSGGTDANLTVIKNQLGLPFIPGRTLKGLLREAATLLNELDATLVTKTFIETVFGVGEDENTHQISKEAMCYFGNAELSQYLSNSLQAEHKKQLYPVLASTAIDDAGQAANGSLRQLEVCIPLTLYANIEHFPSDDANLVQLEHCMMWVKKLGNSRSRGLGRCAFKFYQVA